MVKNERKTWKKAAVCLGFLLFLSGCVGQSLEGEEKAEWISISTPIAENIFQSINNNDYQGFIRDFSEEMKNAMPPEAFTKLKEQLDSALGKYISSTPAKVVERGDYITVYFTAKYEKEDAVTVRVVFKKGDETYKVYGLWFDSPKLR